MIVNPLNPQVSPTLLTPSTLPLSSRDEVLQTPESSTAFTNLPGPG